MGRGLVLLFSWDVQLQGKIIVRKGNNFAQTLSTPTCILIPVMFKGNGLLILPFNFSSSAEGTDASG